MEKKVLSVWISAVVIVAAVCICKAAAGGASEQGQIEKQVQLRVENQEQRLDDIQEVVDREQRRIEEQYLYRLDRLKRLARRRASKFERPIRTVWIEFMRESNRVPYADGYFSRTHINFLDDREIYELRSILSDEYLLSEFADFLMDWEAHEPLKAMASSEQWRATSGDRLVWKEVCKVLAVIREFEWELAGLENRRRACLADLARWEKDQEEDVFTVIGQIKAESKKPETGVVIAISYGRKGVLGMVGGEIIYPGDIVGNVKVTRILRDGIEFEKRGKRWVQKIGEAPDSAWAESF